jgi:hypothetical protein
VLANPTARDSQRLLSYPFYLRDFIVSSPTFCIILQNGFRGEQK